MLIELNANVTPCVGYFSSLRQTEEGLSCCCCYEHLHYYRAFDRPPADYAAVAIAVAAVAASWSSSSNAVSGLQRIIFSFLPSFLPSFPTII